MWGCFMLAALLFGFAFLRLDLAVWNINRSVKNAKRLSILADLCGGAAIGCALVALVIIGLGQ